MNPRVLRQNLRDSDRYFRKSFGREAEVEPVLQSEYQSSLVQRLRNEHYTLTQGEVTIRLASAFGFCWGVERAIAMAYETRRQFPDGRIWITNEIIHNPSVNENLRQMQIEFIPVTADGRKDFSGVDRGSVVILPAFGASVQEMELLHERECVIVDTTCPWVSKVWNRVGKHRKGGYTSIIHGKYKHEETIATSSHAERYLVVLNLEEARYVANYILQGGDRQEFLAKFRHACSEGFDPDRDLERVGIANQTTMLKGETEAIGKLFEHTMLKKYGPVNLHEHFLSFNTICDATQERQDAMFDLVKNPLDVMVVIGGFNSSNTTHLQEIAIEHGIPSYHIDSADRIGPGNRVQHKPLSPDLHYLETVEPWLPAGPITVGVTSGASTPDKVVADVIEKIFAIKG
ncbi:4-hydroxy-3-methylbut-2-enyl diphosphate reductase [Synechococcus sp. C9]|jgi:4-hydroxy-3-methylbut-2-enyl diphosphate reductase|uniref:4-hydroxy-3-methylbut-2-enyl diphosphate reductase n=1 Tax=Synechococcus sp. C9 TaxID=102119 RepID=UPI001FF5289A|nr:4-hydroxy-3-methylbut-2-enyl diphosphate reductase [Synechococcus sp. C9]